MNLFLVHDYRLTKADTTGVVFRRVLASFEEQPHIEFCLIGDAIDRALKRFPELAVFHRSSAPDHIVNLDSRFQECEPGASLGRCTVATLVEIADGIPRRLPFRWASFYFPQVPWLDLELPPDLHAVAGTWSAAFPEARPEPIPGLLVMSRWTPSRREVRLRATVPVDLPAHGARDVGGLPERVTRRLRALGSFKPPRLVVDLEAVERPDATREEQVLRIVNAWNVALPVTLERLAIPHALPVDPVRSPEKSGLTASHKPTLVATLAPRGWRYLSSASGQGVFVLSKVSARGNKLELWFDVGSWSHSCTCFLVTEGPGWKARFPIHFVRGARPRQYPIIDDEAWTMIVENIAVVADHLERTAVAEVEALSPPAPAWFAAH